VGIRHTLNYTAESLVITCTVGDALIWGHKEVKVVLLEDLLEKIDNLERNYVLSQVVIHLEYAGDYLGLASTVLGRFIVILRCELLVSVQQCLLFL
jgi:hypothetical protein